MNTTAAKSPRAKKAKPSAAEIAAKIHQTALDLAPIASTPELLFVPLELIDTAAQVRTEFDDETIRELAEDIAGRGVLQPVLLRRMESGRYLMIAGERRLRAARLAGVASLPAIAGETEQDAADDMQLAENIQREELSLHDTAAAIRRLFDRLGSLQAVADKVHKSKPWVSKRLALSMESFSWRARHLMEEGICEDVETLNALSQLDAIDYLAGSNIEKAIRTGNAGRQTVREALAKAKKAAAEQAQKQKDAKPKQHEEKSNPPPQPHPGEHLIHQLEYIDSLIDDVNADLASFNLFGIDNKAIKSAIYDVQRKIKADEYG